MLRGLTHGFTSVIVHPSRSIISIPSFSPSPLLNKSATHKPTHTHTHRCEKSFSPHVTCFLGNINICLVSTSSFSPLYTIRSRRRCSHVTKPISQFPFLFLFFLLNIMMMPFVGLCNEGGRFSRSLPPMHTHTYPIFRCVHLSDGVFYQCLASIETCIHLYKTVDAAIIAGNSHRIEPQPKMR